MEKEEREVKSVDDVVVAYATPEELEQMSPYERYEAWFNWHVSEIIPYYKIEVMHLHNTGAECWRWCWRLRPSGSPALVVTTMIGR